MKVGFAEVENDGCFYCHKNYQRQGIGRMLFQVIEAGFSTIVDQSGVICREERFTNYRMKKDWGKSETANKTWPAS